MESCQHSWDRDVQETESMLPPELEDCGEVEKLEKSYLCP